MKKQICMLLAALLVLSLMPAAFAADGGADEETGWQAQVVFPDWKGYTDDTLAMNSMFSFDGYHGQGTITVRVSDEAESFCMYINGTAIDTEDIAPGETRTIDISAWTRNGENTLQVSNI